MKKLLLSVSVVMGMTAGQALAADIAPPPVFDWTGFYLGLNGGYAFDGYYGDDVGVRGFGHVGSLNVNGWFGGAQAGYNYQFDLFVLGVEGDIQGGNISDSDSSTSGPFKVKMSDDINWFGTLRGRAGYAFDRV